MVEDDLCWILACCLLHFSAFFTLIFNKGGEGVEVTPNSFIPNLGGSYISNLSLKICLKSLLKSSCGGWWCLNVDLVIGFGPNLDVGTWT